MDEGLLWLSNKDEIQKHLSSLNIFEKLAASDGLIRIENFLPDVVATRSLEILENISEWEIRQNNKTSNDAAKHQFYAAHPINEEDPLTLLMTLMQSIWPGKRSVFTAGKYNAGNHIDEHDDHAYVNDKRTGDTKKVLCSRDIAVIYYLTKDWNESDGGILVDCLNKVRYLPKFNSLVIFEVPRFHKVTQCHRGPRYSLFGWFLEEGTYIVTNYHS